MKKKQKYIGIIYIILSAFCFALMSMFVRLSGDLPAIQKSFFRNLVALVFAGIILAKEKVWFSGKKENVKYLLARATAGTLGVLCNFYAVDHMILSDASMLNKMSPFFCDHLQLSDPERKSTVATGADRCRGVSRKSVDHQTDGWYLFLSGGTRRIVGRSGSRDRLHLCARTRTER